MTPYQLIRVHPDGRREAVPAMGDLGRILLLAQSMPNGEYEIVDHAGRFVQKLVSRDGSVVLGATELAAAPASPPPP